MHKLNYHDTKVTQNSEVMGIVVSTYDNGCRSSEFRRHLLFIIAIRLIKHTNYALNFVSI